VDKGRLDIGQQWRGAALSRSLAVISETGIGQSMPIAGSLQRSAPSAAGV
jgi:hypothetical protein